MCAQSVIVDIAEADGARIARFGGKAAGLGALIRAGERVPPGFAITTEAFESAQEADHMPEPVREQIVAAYEGLGAGRVAVRSSATTEDLDFASFAGQHETVLDVEGEARVLDAVRRCWESLQSVRAVSYRESAGVEGTPARMAVVVQRMIDSAQAGVLFTADPITGSRGRMIVDAVAGRGDVVVDGSAATDHYVLSRDHTREEVAEAGCLGTPQLVQLRDAGLRIERNAGSPQDIEWAFDHDGRLWILQSRAITTLFPLPPASTSDPRALFECGHMQGMLQPFTPMGMSTMRVALAQWLASVGVYTDPYGGEAGLVDVAGRMYLDLTPYLRSSAVRDRLPAGMAVYGPRVASSVALLLDDPRFAPTTRWPVRASTVATLSARLAPAIVTGMFDALARPARARRRAFDVAEKMRLLQPPGGLTTQERVLWAAEVQKPTMRLMTDTLPPLYAALVGKAVAVGLLGDTVEAGEVDETLRGMPYNVTTEMDLALWRLARAAGDDPETRLLLLETPPTELTDRYRRGRLPEFGLREFLDRYGHRCAAEVDVGVAHWAEDPSPVFSAIAGYLRVTDPEQAADLRFARAAAEAEQKIGELIARARRSRPVRARIAGFLMHRSRALAGLRELPKFAWLYTFAQMRGQLLAAGTEMVEAGVLDRADDIMFLDLAEALTAAGGADLRERIALRRAEYEREMKRRSVPGLLLSDGTNPEALAPRTPAPDGSLLGMAAAPGRATGRARVVRDPATANIEPGDILIAPTTDPGWTPLFLTAGGLVTETGSPMAHGPTVAREYGIPAVICLRDATRLIDDGRLITIDGAAGTVVFEDEAAQDPG